MARMRSLNAPDEGRGMDQSDEVAWSFSMRRGASLGLTLSGVVATFAGHLGGRERELHLHGRARQAAEGVELRAGGARPAQAAPLPELRGPLRLGQPGGAARGPAPARVRRIGRRSVRVALPRRPHGQAPEGHRAGGGPAPPRDHERSDGRGPPPAGPGAHAVGAQVGQAHGRRQVPPRGEAKERGPGEGKAGRWKGDAGFRGDGFWDGGDGGGRVPAPVALLVAAQGGPPVPRVGAEAAAAHHHAERRQARHPHAALCPAPGALKKPRSSL
eukprot:1186737-Prorocentrum_minimum.AAC.2